MRVQRAAFWLAWLALLGAVPALASTTAGVAGAQFLKLGAGARAGAMGDAGVAVEGDAFGVYYNPALAARLARPQLAGADTTLVQGITYQTLLYSYPFGKREGREGLETASNRHALSFGIYYLGIADIERRTGDSTDSVGTFNSADAAYAVSYAYAPDDRLSLGVTGKYITETLDSYTANAFAADLGVHYRLNSSSSRPLSVGAAVRHAGTRIGYVSSATDPLPTTVVAGVAGYPLKPLLMTLDVGKAVDTDPYVAFGGELKKNLGDNIAGAFRFGYTSIRSNNDGLNGVTAGAGLSFSKASFDFAWIPFGTLGDSFRFSLLVKF